MLKHLSLLKSASNSPSNGIATRKLPRNKPHRHFQELLSDLAELTPKLNPVLKYIIVVSKGMGLTLVTEANKAGEVNRNSMSCKYFYTISQTAGGI